MGVISRYFERLGALVRPRRVAPPAVLFSAEGLRIDADSMAWSQVRRLDAYKRDVYIGDCLCLAIVSSSGRMFEINEASPGWKEAGDAIERYLPGSVPHAEWMLQLIATSPGQSVAIFPATRA